MLRWAGSKVRSLQIIKKYIPDYTGRYIELFSGSASVFFRLCRSKRAVISDANPDLISFYKAARTAPHYVYDRVSSIPRTERRYYLARDAFHASDDPREKAVLFFFLNRNCFNGIYRTNQAGEFNVPFASDRVAPYPTREEFIRSCAKLKIAKLVCADFESVALTNLRAGDFVYLDPPYYVPDVRTFREYSARHFGEGDIRRLTRVLQRIDSVGAHFLLSYPDCSLARNLASPWNNAKMSAFRSVAATTASRYQARELLIANYDLRAVARQVLKGAN